MNIPTKFGSYWTNGFREECQKQTAPILTLLGLLYLSNTFVQQKHDIYMTNFLGWVQALQ
jgi:hypothetical protein